MAIDMRPEEREVGKANFQRAVGALGYDDREGLSRREFMKGLVAAGAVVPVSAAAYYGYQYNFGAGGKPDKPVRAALIGAGDEGGVLVGEHNPDYLRFVAIADCRPSNQERIFTGDVDVVLDPKTKEVKEKRWKGNVRKGFDHIPAYGGKKEARKDIKVFDSYEKLFKEYGDQFDAVVIALPLHLHAHAAIYAMERGKHVLCEKLMAWSIFECKKMIEAAKKNDVILSIGHQRHYSMLYAHAVEVLKSGVLGDVHHIRALWHRNNALPKLDKDGKPIAGALKDGWFPDIPKDDEAVDANGVFPKGSYASLEELVRWRIRQRTGGGLMAELGSHQLDACSIFLDALAGRGHADGSGPHRPTWKEFLAWEPHEKIHPLSVVGVGAHCLKNGWEVDDHVFCTFEFPGKNYWKDRQWGKVGDEKDVVVVTYSSVNSNAFEPYGECVMGSEGSMIIDSEQTVMLWPEKLPADAKNKRMVSITVANAGSGQPKVESSPSTGGPGSAAAQAVGQQALGSGPVSRGYREEMEDFAYCVRAWEEAKEKGDRPLPRCHAQVAMGDAIIALAANEAMRRRERIEFKKEWFDPENLDAMSGLPDGEKKSQGIIKA